MKEVLVLFGILAILVSLGVFVFDFPKYLAEYRDSQKISDLNKLRAEIILAGIEDCSDWVPENDDSFYSFACDNITKTFKLSANMESARYSQGGKDDVESTDNGNQPDVYEVGTDLGL